VDTLSHAIASQVINQVAASSIGAKLDCDKFASAHLTDSHFDRSSFVGLAWRPSGESICCEIYSTGRANLPGSVRQFDLLTSWARMVPELLRHSDNTDMINMFPPHLRDYHIVGKRRRPSTRLETLPSNRGGNEKPNYESMWDVIVPAESTESRDNCYMNNHDDLCAEDMNLFSNAGI